MKVYAVRVLGEPVEEQLPVAAPTPGKAKSLALGELEMGLDEYLELRALVVGETGGAARVLNAEEAKEFGWEIPEEDDLSPG